MVPPGESRGEHFWGTGHACFLIWVLMAKVHLVVKTQEAVWLFVPFSAWMIFVYKKVINKLWIHMNSQFVLEL